MTQPRPVPMNRRELLLAGASCTTLLALPARAWSSPGFDIVADPSGRDGALPSLSAALDRARKLGRPARILVRGRHAEKLHIDIPGLTLVGAPGATIVYGASAGQNDPDGKPWGTGGSATLTVDAAGVTLQGLAIANSFDFLSSRPSGEHGGRQAVALSLAGGADRSVIRDCDLTGYQDTFYLREGRALVENCRISGGTDFIFGGAAALFRRCRIVSRLVPGAPIQGYVPAPSTPARQEAGLVFDRCRLEREPGVPDDSVFLGRPWRAGGNMELTGMAAFVGCWMDRHIRPEGWTAMHFRAPNGPEGWLTPQQARLYEQGSRGPGAGKASDVRRPLPGALAGIARPARIFGDWFPA